MTYTKEQVIEMFRRKIGDRTQKEVSESLGISAAYLSDMLNGRRNLGRAVLEFVGLEERYVRIAKGRK